MYTQIKKWGNSNAVRIPKELLDTLGLKENDKIEIRIENSKLIIEPIYKHRSLEERIAEFDGEYNYGEWDTGSPKGNEVL
ncbi:MAG: AbrB/MazE/SpoVT family DNA-binding domain-containing protein [Bacillota bacterium]|nr:AbrB/MazE/SpoVT family DNA-binding domain-containing protein [Bacillota bacterium]